MGLPCKCKKKCYDLLTTLERNTVFTDFYKMGDKNIQDAYLGSQISSSFVKRRRYNVSADVDNHEKRRNMSISYCIKVGRKSVAVCQVAFCNLHAIHKSRIYIIAQKCFSGHTTPGGDRRGKHYPRVNKVPDNVISTIHEHIKSFPARESHYSRNESLKKYLPAELNITRMYEMYLEKYEKEIYDLLKQNKPCHPRVKYDFYYRYFVTNFNLSFGYPRSDTCSTCDTLKQRLESATTDQEIQDLLATKELHLYKAKAFYDDLKAKTQLAIQDETVETICFDYQQNLPFAVLPTGEIFYARQLWVYNQGFHGAKENISVMYMFDESIGKKGCIETISFLDHYIKNYLDKKVNKLHIFSDNCAGQNKNSAMVHYLMSLIKHGVMKDIVHHLPEPGHSFLPCDRNFARIEKKKRKKEILYNPEEWYKLVESCGKNFKVVRVSQEMIFDFKSHLQPHFKKTSVVKKVPFSISKYKIFNYSNAHPGEVFVSENHFHYLDFKGYPLHKTTGFDLNAPRAYTNQLPIKYKKFDSIMPIVKKFVPLVHMSFYENLERQKETEHDSD